MPRTRNAKTKPDKGATFSFTQRLKEIDLFFQKKDPVHQSMRRLVRRLERAEIPYAVMGGMAVNAHNYERTTKDVDVLLTSEGFAQFKALFVPRHYGPVEGRPRRFVDRANKVPIDILLTGKFPGSGEPGPIVFPDPSEVAAKVEKYQVVDLPTLVQLKLAARRYRDFGDVVELIRFNNLDESFQAKLHPSIRQDFIECLEEKRREDEYEAQG